MASVTALIHKQTELIKAVDQAIPKFKKLAHAKRTTVTIERRIQDLQRILPLLRDNDAELKTMATTEQLKHSYFTENRFDECMDTFEIAIETLEDALVSEVSKAYNNIAPPSDQASAAPVDHNQPPAFAMPLPKMELPTFSGEINEWEEFRDRFTAMIIRDARLSNADKMKYLYTALTGTARSSIAHLRITDTNFRIAWDSVCLKFQNLRENIAARFDVFHAVQHVSAHSLKSLQNLQEVIRTTSRSIESLGRRVDGWLDLYVDCILRKMDKETRLMLADRLTTDKDPITFEQIEEFLEHRVRLLQSVGRTSAPSSCAQRSDASIRKAPAKLALNATARPLKCVYCSNPHRLNRCANFRKLSVTERRAVVQEKRCCWLCLSTEHSVRDCKSAYRCNECKNKHNILLHPPTTPDRVGSSKPSPLSALSEPNSASAPSKPAGFKVVSHACASNVGLGYSVLLATAWIKVYSTDGRSALVRALLDQGSEVTLITEKVAYLLRTARLSKATRISGVGGITCTAKHTAQIGIGHKDSSTAEQFTEGVIVPTITQVRPVRAANPHQWKHLSGLTLADPDMTSSDPIDVIIGAELFGCFLRNGIRRGPRGSPVAQNTTLGWILSGRYLSTGESSEVTVHVTVLEKLDTTLQKFWEVESLPSSAFLTPDEQECETHFVNSFTRTPDGRYCVRLPFRSGFSGALGNSRSAAFNCLVSVERRLSKDKLRWSAYTDFMQEYENMGHMLPTVSSFGGAVNTGYFIPHHAVFRTINNTSKIRVVFNASRKTSDGSSLNDNLLIGPRLQLDLPSIILRWRLHRFVLTADITKMYRQIIVDARDTPFQQILWRDSASSPVKEYTLQTVTYGTSSAPFLALRVIKQLAIDEGNEFPVAREILRHDTYVDDCIFGANSISEAVLARDQLIQLLARGKFPLAKWSANYPELLRGVASADSHTGEKEFSVCESVHILGIAWNPGSDEFHYNVAAPGILIPTKRLILSTIAKLFDPLGWLSPVIIHAKIFIQRLWALKLDWDDTLPTEISQNWTDFQSQLPLLRDLRIPRWVEYDSSESDIQFHGFCDASICAYAAVVYLRTQRNGETRVSLLMAKTKVAPRQTLTVPRLELCAAVLLSRLLRFITRSLPFENPRCFCWTDSTVVLRWVNSSPAQWKTFIAHRVSDIQRRVPFAEWHHIGTLENPADCASRGLLPQSFRDEPRWWTGPEWMILPMTHWPIGTTITVTSNVDLEERRSIVSHILRVRKPWDMFRRFSSWSRLVRVTARLFRIADRARGIPFPTELTVAELRKARIFWLRYVQSELFNAELLEIQNNTLTSARMLYKLSPFLDDDGLLRVRGRLEKANITATERHPVLLRSHYIVRLIIREKHVQLFHCGPSLLLAVLRKEFWILRPRPLIRSVLYTCTVCARYRAQPAQQLMGDIPGFRVNPSTRPFLHTGVDYAGPISVRRTPGRGYKTTKAYIAVFVCMTTKAVHLEAVSDYTTAAFHATLHRFISRRGLPSDLYSDNGTNFVGEQRELAAAVRAVVNNADTRNQCAERGITWHFIPPSAPHFGGLWEVAVRSVKRNLQKATGLHALTYEELSTILCRIEACINSRPLFPVSDSIDDYSILTPAHFLIGDSLMALPEPSVLDIQENRLSRWQLVQRLTEQFWGAWSRDYLHTLQQRSKWLKPDTTIVPGRLTLLIAPGLPPSRWALGRIVECHPGDDGLVRVVTLKTSTTTLKRPITKICLLPGEINQGMQQEPTA